MEQYYLGFDAGTQSVKTAVYDIDMNLIVQDTNATILNYPSGMGGNGRRPVSSCNGYRDQKLRYKDERKESGSRQHPLYFWRWDHLRDCRC